LRAVLYEYGHIVPLEISHIERIEVILEWDWQQSASARPERVPRFASPDCGGDRQNRWYYKENWIGGQADGYRAATSGHAWRRSDDSNGRGSLRRTTWSHNRLDERNYTSATAASALHLPL